MYEFLFNKCLKSDETITSIFKNDAVEYFIYISCYININYFFYFHIKEIFVF